MVRGSLCNPEHSMAIRKRAFPPRAQGGPFEEGNEGNGPQANELESWC